MEASYEAGSSIFEEEAATFVKRIPVMCSVPERTNTRSERDGWPLRTPTVVVTGKGNYRRQGRRSNLFGRSQEISYVKLAPQYRNIWLVRGHAVPAFSRTRTGGRNKLTIGLFYWVKASGCRWFPNGGELEFEERVAYKTAFVSSYAALPHGKLAARLVAELEPYMKNPYPVESASALIDERFTGTCAGVGRYSEGSGSYTKQT